MSMRDQLYEAIKSKLKAEVEDMDWEDVIDNTAQIIIDEEIGDIQKAAEVHVIDEMSDWAGHYGAQDILNEILDNVMDK